MADAGRHALHVVLLAGGSGTRFWPASRVRRPKQFLALGGRRPLIEDAWRRARRLAPAERLWVVAPRPLARSVRAALPELAAERLVIEPSPRDTGPAIALAVASVARVAPQAVIGVFPTDHVIVDVSAFTRSVRAAVAAARDGALVCLGVRPDRPATGFGYLLCAEPPIAGRAVPVSRFVEKPVLSRARRYLADGRYLWNAGMFVWTAQSFLAELQRTAPEIDTAVSRHLSGARGAWERAPKLSVDYAVMEHARGVAVVALDAGWDDVGSWDAAARLREAAGLAVGTHIAIDSPGSVIVGERRIVALVGVPDVVVVDTADALLVVSRAQAESVRAAVEELRKRGRDDLL